MNAALTLAARTLVEHLRSGMSQEEMAAACDAILHSLHDWGLSRSQIAQFPKVVAQELRRHGPVGAILSTSSGNTGASAPAIAAALEKSLGRSIDLEESSGESLIGGALLSIGDERLDFTLRGALQQLATHLSSSSA